MMPAVKPKTLRLLCLAFTAASASACAFPVFNLEEEAAPHQLAYRGLDQESGRSRSVTSERYVPRQHASVIAPIVPEAERQAPDLRSESACDRMLARAGVRFERLPRGSAPGVAWPIRLDGPVHGVTFEPLDRDPVHTILDCRLGSSLVAWAIDLRRAHVRRVVYYSMYRPGARIAGSGAVSAHAHGMAIDAARFELEDGQSLAVLDDWEGRKHGQAPCPVRRDETSASRLLRRVTCAAADDGMFQIVLTPHYNKAHANHVHLERKPDVDWTFVR